MRDEHTQQAFRQYGASTRNLDLRVALHRFRSNPLPWADFVQSRLPCSDGDRVLDVGAGTGVHWQAPTPLRPVLLDLHEPMCHALLTLGHPVVLASAEQLPFAARSYDGVLSTHVLYHVPDPGRAVAEMLRVLRPGGWIVLASNGPRHMSTLDDLRRSVGLDVDRSFHDRFGIEDAVLALRSCGLQPARHDYTNDLLVTDAAAAVGYCSTLDDLSPSQEAGMLHQVQAAIDADGHYRVVAETALVVARTDVT